MGQLAKMATFCRTDRFIYSVSVTVGMSTTVEEMSATVRKRSVTVGEFPRQWRNCLCSMKFGEWRFLIITLHRLVLSIHGTRWKKPIMI